MDPRIPHFTYYDPIAAAKVFAASELACDVCGVARGLVYTSSFFSLEDEPTICANCVASGAAARKFDGSFHDCGQTWEPRNLAEDIAGPVPAEVLAEIRDRTPAYESWQENEWLFHCSDAALFRGDASAEEVAKADPPSRAWWEAVNERPREEELNGYAPGQALGVYRFDCRHCGLKMFHWDRG